MQYIAIRHCTNYWAVTETETYSEHCQTFKMEHFAKRMSAGARNFLRAGRFVKLGHFDKHFAKKWKKKGPSWETNLEIFLLDTLKTIFWTENLTQGWTKSGPFFPKSGHSFSIFKKRREDLPSPPFVARLWV